MKNKKVDAINNSIVEAKKRQAVSDGLSEIYHDDDGKLIDVRKLDIRKKHGLNFWLIASLIVTAVAIVSFFGIRQILKQGITTDALDFKISLEKQPTAGEEFLLLVDYKNNNQLGIENAEIHLTYPDEFIYLDSMPTANSDHNTWRIGNLPAGAVGQIKIKAKLISEIGKNNVLTGELRYNPEGFSAELKKVAELNLNLSDIGLDVNIVNSDSTMVGEKQKIVVKYRARQKYLDNFRLVIEPANPNNVEFIADVQKNLNIELVKPWVWQVNNITDQEQELIIYYKVIDKITDKQFLDFKFSYRLSSQFGSPEALASSSSSTKQLEDLVGKSTADNSNIEISRPIEKYYLFKQHSLDLELVKNSLNLLLLINGSDKDQGVDFGQTLNYSLSYSNKGETPLEDISFTVLVDGDLVDWSSFKDKNHGLVKNGTITWTKDQLKELTSLGKGANGIVDFSLKLKEAQTEIKSSQIKSHAQFQSGQNNDLESLIRLIKEREAKVDMATTTADGQIIPSASIIMASSNQSNVIVNNVNSDFQVEQKILYFNDDNIPVGNGPLPLEVGKETSLRVYWKIKNSFHDLDTVKVAVKLPDYAVWQERSSLSGGSIRWDALNRQVIWEMQNMPKTIGEATAEFSLSFKPRADQRNQIIVLLPACEATANDVITKSSIRRTSKIKTSKLEDDLIIRSVNLDAASGLIK